MGAVKGDAAFRESHESLTGSERGMGAAIVSAKLIPDFIVAVCYFFDKYKILFQK